MLLCFDASGPEGAALWRSLREKEEKKEAAAKRLKWRLVKDMMC